MYSSAFQKSRLLLRMLPRRSLNQFRSTLLKRSERTTGCGEQWLLESKNRELIWKSLNHTKKSFHMEVGEAVSIFKIDAKNSCFIDHILFLFLSCYNTDKGRENLFFSLGWNQPGFQFNVTVTNKNFKFKAILEAAYWHICVRNNLVTVEWNCLE